jgi:hypothetical protein
LILVLLVELVEGDRSKSNQSSSDQGNRRRAEAIADWNFTCINSLGGNTGRRQFKGEMQRLEICA